MSIDKYQYARDRMTFRDDDEDKFVEEENNEDEEKGLVDEFR